MIITRSFKDICIDKPPLQTDVFDGVNTPISCINTTEIDDIERSRWYSLKDIAKYSTIPYENIPPLVLVGDGNLSNTYVSRNAKASCRLLPPVILNNHIHPFRVSSPKCHWYMKSVTQFLFLILRTISYNFQFNFSTEDSLSKCPFETSHCAYSSIDVNALKFWLVHPCANVMALFIYLTIFRFCLLRISCQYRGSK